LKTPLSRVVNAKRLQLLIDYYKRIMMSKKVLITGICGGLGMEMAKGFIKKGYQVIGVDIDDLALEGLEDKLGQEIPTFVCDLRNRGQIEQLCMEVVHKGVFPDIWINNAGVATIAPFMEQIDSFSDVMDINFNSILYTTHFCVGEMMKRNQGMIVNIASVAGHAPCPYFTSYNASKFAVVGFTRSLRHELKLKKIPIDVVLVSPGFVDTNIINQKSFEFPDFMKFMLSKPEVTGKEIVDGILKGKNEIFPTLNGKLLLGLGKVGAPVQDMMGHLMNAKNWKQMFGIEKIDPK